MSWPRWLFHRSIAVLFGVFAVALVASNAVIVAQDAQLAPEKVVPRNRGDLTVSYSKVVKLAAPAVVNVYVVQQAQRRRSPFSDDPFFRRFFGEDSGNQGGRQQGSLGSGVIVSPDGLVITNNHVVQSEGEAAIKVALSDSREFEAKIILRDERSDLAVLRIEGEKDFPYLPFADSDSLEVGDIVLAIGNPFGVGQTVTSGIISALARTRVGISDYQFFIQTDAAINPGNSGGPLVDMNGRIAGINTAIYSRSGGGSLGIGFSIPSNMVRVVVNSALRGGKVERPWLGAELQEMTSELARAMGLDRPAGAIVESVTEGGPAAKAGLKPGDVITAVDGRDANGPQAVFYRFATKGVGGNAELDVTNGGHVRKVRIALVAAPETVPRDLREISGANPFAGATVANLSPAVAEELSIEETSGVVVVETSANSTARRVGLRPGDVIISVNGKAVQGVKDLADLLKRPVRSWDLRIRRGGDELRTVVRA
jgi:Do/DeqQ family serine protease